MTDIYPTSEIITSLSNDNRLIFALVLYVGLFTAAALLFVGIQIGKKQTVRQTTAIQLATTAYPTAAQVNLSAYRNNTYGVAFVYDMAKYILKEDQTSIVLQEKAWVGKDTHGYTKLYFDFYPNQQINTVILADENKMNKLATASHQKTTQSIYGLKFVKTIYSTAIGDVETSLYLQSQDTVIKIHTLGKLSDFDIILSTFKLINN